MLTSSKQQSVGQCRASRREKGPGWTAVREDTHRAGSLWGTSIASDTDHGFIHIWSTERQEPGIGRRENGNPKWEEHSQSSSGSVVVSGSTNHHDVPGTIESSPRNLYNTSQEVTANRRPLICQPHLVGSSCLGHGVGCIQTSWEKGSWWVTGVCSGQRVPWCPWLVFAVSILRDAHWSDYKTRVKLKNFHKLIELFFMKL